MSCPRPPCLHYIPPQGCFLQNLGKNSGNLKNCPIIYQSLSDSIKANTSTVVQLQGIAFAEEMCFVIANVGTSAISTSVQVYQYYDCECPLKFQLYNLWHVP